MSAAVGRSPKREFLDAIKALRPEALAVSDAGPSGPLAVEAREAVESCERFSKCQYDRAIARSYARCRSMPDPRVAALCGITTKGMEKIGDGASAAYNTVKGWVT